MLEKEKTALEKRIREEYRNIIGLVIQKNDSILFESYFNNCTSANTIHIASVTKSIFSALIGIAIHNGQIKSIHQKVLDYFPEYPLSEENKTIKNITIEHLLTMTAPYKCQTEPYEEFFTSPNWMDYALGILGGHGTIGEFQYSPIVGCHILSGILAKATQQPILKYANEKLFAPLKINANNNIILKDKEEHLAFLNTATSRGWVVDPQGINPAGWGLTLSPTDMAKIGQLYLNSGRWYNTQIIPEAWVKESTTVHSRWGTLSYGYLWWVIDDDEKCFAAMGDGGNTIYIDKVNRTVIAIAGLFAPDANDSIELIKNYIEPILN